MKSFNEQQLIRFNSRLKIWKRKNKQFKKTIQQPLKWCWNKIKSWCVRLKKNIKKPLQKFKKN